MSPHPEAIRRAKDWAAAIKIIDATERPMRDLIERDLAPVANLREDRIAPSAITASITARLIRKITKLRSDAFKQAFRLLREHHV